MFHCVPLVLTSVRTDDCDGLSFVIKTSFLVSFSFVFVSPCVGWKSPSLDEMYQLLNE